MWRPITEGAKLRVTSPIYEMDAKKCLVRGSQRWLVDQQP